MDKLTVTPENLLAAFTENEHARRYPRTIGDLADAFIRANGRDPYNNPLRDGRALSAQQLRNLHVSPTAVARAAATLVEQGKLVQRAGTEIAKYGAYGIRAASTYFLLPEDLQLLQEEHQRLLEEDWRRGARKDAEDTVLLRYRDDVEAEYQQILKERGIRSA